MRPNEGKKQRDKATLASVRKEMAKPRMARSARIAQQNPGSKRILEPPKTTLPRTVTNVKLKRSAHVEVTVTAGPKK
jgi:hypothetical protein